MGASTAWWLARRGLSTVVLEQFEPEHTRGSSHGGSRIFRLAYPEPFWVGLARAARMCWDALEIESGTRVITETGSVDHGDPAAVETLRLALQSERVTYEILAPAAAESR